MNNKNPFLPSFKELPITLPIFPLSGAVVLPGGTLPLNIFEPRYLNMIRDTLKADSLIGMIQTKQPNELYGVGCAARVSQYSETADGRLHVVLTGVCRFKIDQEIECLRGYRLIMPNWQGFEDDFEASAFDVKSVTVLKQVLKSYFTHNDIQVDWALLDELNAFDLVNNLVSGLPLKPEDKQLIIETPLRADFIESLITILSLTEDKNTVLH